MKRRKLSQLTGGLAELTARGGFALVSWLQDVFEGKGMRRPNHCIGGEIRATYRIPIVLDYAAARSPNQADQSDPEKKRHCEREQGASPLFFIHVYICEKWPRKGSRGFPLS